ncbi:MAG: SprT-like domain-containing protein [bacterium]|nr:SprT-like domain-containing protein [bacterium]
MSKSKAQKKALAALNFDLFQLENITPIAPATIDTKIRQHQQQVPVSSPKRIEVSNSRLPSIAELQQMYNRFNWQYFGGKLPAVHIEYSSRMLCAGSCNPREKLIRMGKKYHQIFPSDIEDTLKHEMIHLIHFNHDANFRREARRVGTSVRARSHPSLRRPPKYLYHCKSCGAEYPRQKRLRMASCGKCSRGRKFDLQFKLRLKKS